jgi:hypothetical protein
MSRIAEVTADKDVQNCLVVGKLHCSWFDAGFEGFAGGFAQDDRASA